MIDHEVLPVLPAFILLTIVLVYHYQYCLTFVESLLETDFSEVFCYRIQFNSEEQWTKALKFLLTNLKWGLAWVSSQFTKDEADTVQQ
jgi:hypothetical protein